MAKVKRYNGVDGSVTEGANSGIDDGTRARAMEFMRDREENPGMYEAEPEENFKPTPKAKAPVVTKEQLSAFQKKFGADKTLRDYMNDQKGLTRRGEKAAAPTAKAEPETKTETKAASTPTTKRPNILEEAKEGVRRSNAAREAISAASRQRKAGDMPKRGPGLSALSGMKKGGEVKGWGMARGARKAKIY